MKYESPDGIKIRLEVDIPSGLAGKRRSQFLRHRPRSVGTVPDVNDTALVRPVSGSGLGFICARATFGIAQHTVWAKVYPEDNASPHAQPPNGALEGDTSDDLTWTWNGAKELATVNHSSTTPFPKNTLVFWHKENASDSWTIFPIPFSGQTGSGPCGSGSGDGEEGARIRLPWSKVPLPRRPVATVAEATGSLASLIGLSVPMSYRDPLPKSHTGDGWFGLVSLGSEFDDRFLEISMAPVKDRMAVGVKLVKAPRRPRLHGNAVSSRYSATPFHLKCRIRPEARAACGLTLTITE